MISQVLPIYVALEPVDMRLGYERLGGLVRERMQAEPRSKALFVFVGKRGEQTTFNIPFAVRGDPLPVAPALREARAAVSACRTWAR